MQVTLEYKLTLEIIYIANSRCLIQVIFLYLHSQLPPEFSRLSKALRTVDVSNNKLHELPSMFSQFTNLKSLTVNNNRLGKGLCFIFLQIVN